MREEEKRKREESWGKVRGREGKERGKIDECERNSGKRWKIGVKREKRERKEREKREKRDGKEREQRERKERVKREERERKDRKRK